MTLSLDSECWKGKSKDGKDVTLLITPLSENQRLALKAKYSGALYIGDSTEAVINFIGDSQQAVVTRANGWISKPPADWEGYDVWQEITAMGIDLERGKKYPATDDT